MAVFLQACAASPAAVVAAPQTTKPSTPHPPPARNVQPPWNPDSSLYDLTWKRAPYRDAQRLSIELTNLSRQAELSLSGAERCDGLLKIASLYFQLSNALDDSKTSRDALLQAHELHLQLVAGCPNYERSDLVLFALAQSHWLLGDRASAVDVSNRLVAQFPESVFALDAAFLVGERLFLAHEYEAAIAAFTAVPSKAGYVASAAAKFRLAECYNTLGRYAEAFESARWAVGQLQECEANWCDLLVESARAFVEAYSHVGQPEDARRTFAEIMWAGCGNICSDMLERLRSTWLHSGDTEKVQRLDTTPPNPD